MQSTPLTDHKGQLWHPDDYFMNGRLSASDSPACWIPRRPDLFSRERYGHFKLRDAGRYAGQVHCRSPTLPNYISAPECRGTGESAARDFQGHVQRRKRYWTTSTSLRRAATLHEVYQDLPSSEAQAAQRKMLEKSLTFGAQSKPKNKILPPVLVGKIGKGFLGDGNPS